MEESESRRSRPKLGRFVAAADAAAASPEGLPILLLLEPFTSSSLNNKKSLSVPEEEVRLGLWAGPEPRPLMLSLLLLCWLPFKPLPLSAKSDALERDTADADTDTSEERLCSWATCASVQSEFFWPDDAGPPRLLI